MSSNEADDKKERGWKNPFVRSTDSRLVTKPIFLSDEEVADLDLSLESDVSEPECPDDLFHQARDRSQPQSVPKAQILKGKKSLRSSSEPETCEPILPMVPVFCDENDCDTVELTERELKTCYVVPSSDEVSFAADSEGEVFPASEAPTTDLAYEDSNYTLEEIKESTPSELSEPEWDELEDAFDVGGTQIASMSSIYQDVSDVDKEMSLAEESFVGPSELDDASVGFGAESSELLKRASSTIRKLSSTMVPTLRSMENVEPDTLLTYLDNHLTWDSEEITPGVFIFRYGDEPSPREADVVLKGSDKQPESMAEAIQAVATGEGKALGEVFVELMDIQMRRQ